MKTPQVNLSGGGIVALVLLAGGAYLAYELIVNKDKVISWFNPTNANNLANQGATSVLQSIGIVKPDASIGTTIYDWFHPEQPTVNGGG